MGGAALKSLTALSMGIFGTATGGAVNGDGTLESTIRGGLGALKVNGDMAGVWINVSEASGGDGTGNIDAITIGGSLVGGATPNAGQIKAVGDIGAIKIGRDLIGAVGAESGKIDAGGKLKTLTIGGSIHGGGGGYETFLDGNAVRCVNLGDPFHAVVTTLLADAARLPHAVDRADRTNAREHPHTPARGA